MKRLAITFALGWFFMVGQGKLNCGNIVFDENAANSSSPPCIQLKSLLPPQGPFPTQDACEAALDTFIKSAAKDLIVYSGCQGTDSPD